MAETPEESAVFSDDGRLTALYEAALQAVEPRPGKRCDALVVAMVWVDELHAGTYAVMDVMGTPGDKVPRVLNEIHRRVSEWKQQGWNP